MGHKGLWATIGREQGGVRLCDIMYQYCIEQRKAARVPAVHTCPTTPNSLILLNVNTVWLEWKIANIVVGARLTEPCSTGIIAGLRL